MRIVTDPLIGFHTRLALPLHQAVAWARGLDHPVGGARPVAPPRPNPPVATRPSRLSVTEIETWLRDPYAIYARHILRLPALRPLEQATDAADYGSIVHAGIHRFIRLHGAVWPADAQARLREAMRIALAETYPRPALAAWWEPRLYRIADWICGVETARRALLPPSHIATEVLGKMEIIRPGRRFTLTGRADRIERRADGALVILDYKTGQIPSAKDVASGLAPQLPLEAMMLAAGAFGGELTGDVAELVYWKLTGGIDPGEEKPLFKGKDADRDAAIAAADAGLAKLIDDYDQPDRCYLAQPNPSWTPRFSDYAQLERVAEWALAVDPEEEDDA